MHIQQNSYLHWLQLMWLQPWFFSMRVWHFGHLFVFAKIQLAVSLSFEHFTFHSLTRSQLAGSCTSSPHRKQKERPHEQSTCVTPFPTAILSQPGAGQKRNFGLAST